MPLLQLMMLPEKRRKETLQSPQAHRIVTTHHLKLYKIVPHRTHQQLSENDLGVISMIIFFRLPFISIKDVKYNMQFYQLSLRTSIIFLHKMGMFHDKNPNKKKSLMSLST